MIKGIFAMDCWGGMGVDGTLPWPHHKEDMRYFKEQTEGHIVVMGRKSWDDPKMPKPLPNRQNYVVTTKPFYFKNVKVISRDPVANIKKLAAENPNKIIWVIGGPNLLEQTKHILEELHVTHFKAGYKTKAKIEPATFFEGFRITSAKPANDRECNWVTYKNLDIKA